MQFVVRFSGSFDCFGVFITVQCVNINYEMLRSVKNVKLCTCSLEHNGLTERTKHSKPYNYGNIVYSSI